MISMDGRTAVVIGASGRIGAPLCHAMQERGWRVVGAARFRNEPARVALESAGVGTIRFDVTLDDPLLLPAADCVWLELWDPVQPEFLWDTNFHGVGRVVERYCGVADIINGSTIEVYGASPNPASETDLPRPTSEYGQSRLALEHLVEFFARRGGKRFLHLRYAHVNSAEAGLVRRMADAIRVGQTLTDPPAARVQLIAIEDTVRMTVDALEHFSDCLPAINIVHPKLLTRRALARRIARELSGPAPVFASAGGGRQASLCARGDLMVAHFGTPRAALDQVIRRACQALDGTRPTAP